MTPRDWRRLGIDPVADKGAIRRAYATALKAMDVDADPDGFAQLRAARDAALAWVESGGDPAVEDEDEDDDFDFDSFDFDMPTHHEPPVSDQISHGQPADVVDAIDAHYRALVALLFTDAPPTPDDADAITGHGQVLLADPRMEDVGFAASAESWFADNLAASIPRSDPLLEPAAALFGWIDRRDDYALLPGARQVVERIGATRYVALIAEPSHPLHRAWYDLTHADGRKLGRRGDVDRVMTTVRNRFPAAEAWMHPDRVAAWDATARKAEPGPGKLIVWSIIAIVVLIRVFILSPDDDRRAPPPSVAVMPDADAAARLLTGHTAAEVRAVNPPLAAMIDRAIVPPMGTTSPEPVYRAIADLGNRQAAAGLRDASDDLVRNLARWEVDAMRARRSTDPAACVGVHIAADATGLSQPLRDRQRGLLHQVILHSRETAVDTGDLRFTVPATILPRIARLSGFDGAKVRQALRGAASDAERCTVDIALRDVALALPIVQGDALLRDMQPLLNH